MCMYVFLKIAQIGYSAIRKEANAEKSKNQIKANQFLGKPDLHDLLQADQSLTIIELEDDA